MQTFELASWFLGPSGDLINVLDVGALDIGDGSTPYERLVQAGLARVIGFEPDPRGCEALNRRFGPPHRFLPYFVGDGTQATFHETNWAATGLLFRPNRPVLEKFQNLHELVTLRGEHPVETKRLDDIEEVVDIDFIKIDVQGAELQVFEGGQSVLEDVVLIQTEVEFVELYEGQPMFADVDRFLRARGFQFHTFDSIGTRCFKPMVVNNNVNKGIRQYLWADAIYVRDWMAFDGLRTEKLKKLAVLCHDVVASPDLCHLVLSRIDARSGSDYAARYFQALAESRRGPS